MNISLIKGKSNRVKWGLTQSMASLTLENTVYYTQDSDTPSQEVLIRLHANVDAVTPNIEICRSVFNDGVDVPTALSDIYRWVADNNLCQEWRDAVEEYKAVIPRIQLPHTLQWEYEQYGGRRITTHYFRYKGKHIDCISVTFEPTQTYAFITLDKKSRKNCSIGPVRLPLTVNEAVLNKAIRLVLEANSFLIDQPKYLSSCLRLLDREIPPLPLLTYNHTLEHCDVDNMSPYINLPRATISTLWGRLAYTYSANYINLKDGRAYQWVKRRSQITVVVVPNNRDNFDLFIELIVDTRNNDFNDIWKYVPIGPIVTPLPIDEEALYKLVWNTLLDTRDQLYEEGARGSHPDNYFIPIHYNRGEVRQIIKDLIDQCRMLLKV